MSRIAVAMSGGVDSSTAAALLREQGNEVIGVTLQLWDYSEVNLAAGKGRCCSPADIADARSIAAHLHIPHYVFDHSESFMRAVVDPFVREYADGRTPSPCIRCNRTIKFDVLVRLARGLEAQKLATGHYARLTSEAGRPQLRKASDREKDQSYFLFDVSSAQLENVCFPLGELSKEQVRAAASRFGLSVADKSESFELCFIPDGDKDAFVQERLGSSRANPGGQIRTTDGRLVGTHTGLHRFTIGQRRGLGIASNEPLYVIDLDAATHQVTVGTAADLESDGLIAAECNWISIPPPAEPMRARARIRHRHQEAPATLSPLGSNRYEVRFDATERAIAPGQGVAFYDGDLLLGGGWIESRLTAE